MTDSPSRLRGLVRGVLLRCPRCGVGPLFHGLFRMRPACPACGLSFAREPGFYLGSIYFNYGFTVILTGALYATLVLAVGTSHEVALVACLATAVAFPILFFRHARSLLLALDSSVNEGQLEAEQLPGDTGLGARRLASLASDDGRAGCALGVALVLILLFGIGMAVATLWFTGDALPPLD
ncbi:MAG: DUF983 domain-containing protein [Planctomycetia bacterium]